MNRVPYSYGRQIGEGYLTFGQMPGERQVLQVNSYLLRFVRAKTLFGNRLW